MTRFYFILNVTYLLPFLILLSPNIRTEDEGPFEENTGTLWIETHQQGPYVVNSSVVFSCIHKLKDRYESLTWNFILSDNSTSRALIDSSFDDTSVGFNRTSSIRIPGEEVSAISCLWSNLNGSKTSASLPINLTGLPSRMIKRHVEDDCPIKGPQIFFTSTSPNFYNNSCDTTTNYDFENRTGQTISLDVSSFDRFILACVHVGNKTNKTTIESSQWSLQMSPETSTIKPSKTLVLNYLALINWKRLRLQPKACLKNSDTQLMKSLPVIKRNYDNCQISDPSGPLEVFIAPETSPVTSVFKCSSGDGQESQITVITQPEKELKKEAPIHPASSSSNNKDDNREFLELINALMQILQASESSGGGSPGNGGLYGVGFGSSTIIVLMAIAIYYLKRQIKQLQDQVELGERRRRKSRPSRAQAHEDDEEEADDL